MVKTILVTGSNGLIGQKVVHLLADRPAIDVVAWSRGPNRHPRKAGYVYETVELLDGDLVRAKLQELTPDAIIHCAAMSQADACEADPEACHYANVGTVEHLVVGTHGLDTQLVLLSTDFVFDGAAGPYREDAEPAPLNVYGKSKLTAEQVLLRQNQPVTVLRTALVYGHAPHLTRSNLVLWVVDSLQKETPIRVVSDQFRTPTLAEDIADACAAAVLGRKTGIYHVSGAEEVSVFEMAQRTALVFGLNAGLISPIETAQLNEAAKRPLKTGFVILKAQTELGFQPHGLDAGLARVKAQLERA